MLSDPVSEEECELIQRVPFNRPTRAAEESAYIADCLAREYVNGSSHYSNACADLIGKSVQSHYATLTPSCTHALELAALSLDLGPSDEVIAPSFTFTSTVNAFLLRGATTRFADIRPDTLNIDPQSVERLVTPRTRVIIAMHYAGIACDMDALKSIADDAGAVLVEDAAHAFLGTYKGRPLGSIGSIGTFSFHKTKNFSCGEGGAFVTNDPAIAEQAELVREKGTNRSLFLKGMVEKYQWMRSGSSYVIAELLAAQLMSQLEQREEVQAKRQRIWNRYQERLADWAGAAGIQQPHVPNECDPAWHLYFLIMPTTASRDAFLDFLREKTIGAAFHYLPLHLTPMGRTLGGEEGDAPITESYATRLVRLPFFTDMTEEEQNRVIDVVRSFPLN
jgi:dTDP-4-amino-4,6-dideoxygalactose transaminase